MVNNSSQEVIQKTLEQNYEACHSYIYGDVLIPLSKVLELTSLSASSLVRMENNGDFPKRRRLSQCRVAWVLSEVQAWIQSRIDAVA